MGNTHNRGVKPTRSQKQMISKAGKDPKDYLVLDETDTELVLVRRGDGKPYKLKI